ncbi:395_t:CDS:10 [Ambispora leptoticha]|uniref:Eukaryotic translation initiation factor 3 subunit C n=1 Tax=Ambispora leptoticha TaxID=144679 RepID=A0A9N8VSB3_9GLOM|nr:395_t:CDS:10 [Ambispora leptoticha]
MSDIEKSRFFHGSSDSESEGSLASDSDLSDDEELSEDSDELEEDKNKSTKPTESRFKKGAASASDSEESSGDEKRVVKSHKDKRLEELESTIKTLENAQKINDWVVISNEFDKLNKVISKMPPQNEIPRLYIKAIAELEDFLNESMKKDAKKKMNPSNAKALVAMKQKLKKNNKIHEEDIEKWRKNPVSVENDEEDVIIEREIVPTIDVEITDESFTPVGKGGKPVEYTAENLFKKLKEVLEARGKKNTDRLDQIRVLHALLLVANTPYQQIRVLLALIPAQFDYNQSMSGYMGAEMWKNTQKEINQLLAILENNKQFIIHEDVEDEQEEKEPTIESDQIYGIRGSIVSFIDRLDDEFTKSLQNIDPHTTDYVDRLKDETELYATIVRGQIYFEKNELNDSTSRVIMRRLEHLYYKPDQVIQTVENTVKQLLPSDLSSEITPPTVTQDSSDLIHALCVYLYKKGASLLRTRAMLCHIYHHALHNRFYVARDMLLMSHLQETIHQADVATQILHNRTMVQVGLCAFREGMIKEAQSCLQEICGTGRTKELLAQGLQLQRYAQLPPEQEKLDRQRQLPFHMHINLELLECAYLTCSMLLEIPSMAAAGSNPEARKKVISKPFRRMLDYNERQIFSGPPENTRDHIMGAAKALAGGEWQRCQELIGAIKIWDLMPETQKIKEMLNRKIQEEGLRTYLFTYSAYYTTLGLEQLGTMFGLPINAVTSIISKMIWNEELAASLDQVNNAVVLHRVEPTKVQQLALMFAEKAVTFVENNERQFNQQHQNTEKRTTYQKGSGGSGRGRNNFNNVLGNSVRGRAQQNRYRSLYRFFLKFETIDDEASVKRQWSRRQYAVRNAFKHAWNGYVRDAWGYDEYHPISRSGSNLTDLGGIGYTIIDSLDTMIIMNLYEEYIQARDWVANKLDFNIDAEVSLFETTIRVLGGLLSAYHLSGNDTLYLTKAKDLGDRLLGAFESPTHVPFASVNLATQQGIAAHFAQGASSVSEATTLQLEFKYLSYLTGDDKYWRHAESVMFHIDDLDKLDGLVPIYISPSTGNFQGQKITLGARGDSYYEYLLKQYLQTDRTEPFYHRMYTQAMRGMKNRLIARSFPNKLLYVGELAYYDSRGVKVEDYTKLNGEAQENLLIAKMLTETCVLMYFKTATGLAPEITFFETDENGVDDMIIKHRDAHNLLRPETVESLFVLWRITGDNRYREWGWRIFKAFEKYAKVDGGGYSALIDVTSIPPGRLDKMETFWLAETLKYLYLLFEDPDSQSLPLDKYVFNTEAHPLPIFRPSPKIRGNGWNRI